MPSFLTNFAALNPKQRDLLTPIEYRTIVEMINGILRSPHFKIFNNLVKLFEEHLASTDPLFLESGVNFKDVFAEAVYDVYVHMLPNPVSLDEFKTDIVPSIRFPELVRRIFLNKYLYSQIRNVDGSVAASTYTQNVLPEWNVSETYPTTIDLVIPNPLADEIAFIESAWQGANTEPVAVIQSAVDLSIGYMELPVIFAHDRNIDIPPSDTLESAFNSMTVRVSYKNLPSESTTLVTLQNGIDNLFLILNEDGILSLKMDDTVILTAPIASTDGNAVLIIDSRGDYSLQVTSGLFQFREKIHYVLKHQTPFNTVTLLQTPVDAPSDQFCLNTVTIYQGFEPLLVSPDEIVAPLGYVVLVDKDGAYLTDRDGTPLMDLDIEPGADIRGNFSYLIDEAGSYLIDITGAFYITPADDFYLIVDDDGTPLLDDDGKFIIEAL